MTTLLYEDEWTTITLEPVIGLVRYARKAVPYTSVADIERSYAGAGSIVPRLTPGLKLLIDLRLAPPRNDAAFEARTGNAVLTFAKRFSKMATLVRTAVGKLQSVRLANERGAEAHVFDDEEAALTYLNGG